MSALLGSGQVIGPKQHKTEEKKKKKKWWKKKWLWILAPVLFLILTYFVSYGFLSRSGILAPGYEKPIDSQEKVFVLLQQKPFTWKDMFTRDRIYVEKDIVVTASIGSFLTKFYTPAGHMHRFLDGMGLWPGMFSPEKK